MNDTLSTYIKALRMSRSRYNYINGDKLHPRHQEILLRHRKKVNTLMKYTVTGSKVVYEFDLHSVVSVEIDSLEELEPFAKSYNALHFTGGPTHEIH